MSLRPPMSRPVVVSWTESSHVCVTIDRTAKNSIYDSPTMSGILGRHGSVSLCRDERENKMAATYNVLAFKR